MRKILTMANPIEPKRAPGPDGAVTVGIGEIVVTAAPTRLTTVLGSCIGVIVHDPRARVGGIAHVMLPEATGAVSPAAPGKYADVAVPELIRRVREAARANGSPLQIKIAGGAAAGGQAVLPLSGMTRDKNIQVKLVGGANMFARLNGNAALQIGPRNETAARAAIKKLGLSIRGEDVGGARGRKVLFDPETGAVRVILLGGMEKEI